MIRNQIFVKEIKMEQKVNNPIQKGMLFLKQNISSKAELRIVSKTSKEFGFGQ